MTTTQDSTEDWLSEILNDLHFTALAHIDGSHASDDSHVVEAKAKIRQHMLSEALELLKDEPESESDNNAGDPNKWIPSIRNELRDELRKAFTEKYGERE